MNDFNGKYSLYVDGLETKIVDENGNEGKSFCSSLIGFGDRVFFAMQRLKEAQALKIGDRVQIIDNGETYCNFNNFANLNDIPIETVTKYRYGCIPDDNIVGTVKHIIGENICCVEIKEENKASILINGIYLIGRKGLKKL